MKKIILLIIFIPLITFSQKEIATFNFPTDYYIKPLLSFSQNGNHYILSNFTKTNSKAISNTFSLHLLTFDANYDLTSRKRIKYNGLNLNRVQIKSITNINTGLFKIILNYKTKDSYELRDYLLDINKKDLTLQKLVYTIPLPEKIKQKYFKIVSDKNHNIYIFNLLLDEKNIAIYSLSDTSYKIKKIQLNKDSFKNLKSNFTSLDKGGQSQYFLDTPVGQQYYIKDHFIFFLTSKSGPKNRSNLVAINSPLEIIKLNLETGQVEEKKLIDNNRDLAFTIVNNNLFYTYGETGSIFLKIMNLDDFKIQTFEINNTKYNALGLEAEFKNYSTKPKKTKTEKVNFNKFYRKYFAIPSIAVKQINDSIFDFKLGTIAYHYKATIGDAILNTALANLTGGLLNNSNFINNNYNYISFNSNNGIPNTYQTAFSINLSNKTISNKNTAEMSPKRTFYLNHFDYFYRKRAVGPIINSSKEEPFIYIYRDSKNWQNFYIYNFEK